MMAAGWLNMFMTHLPIIYSRAFRKRRNASVYATGDETSPKPTKEERNGSSFTTGPGKPDMYVNPIQLKWAAPILHTTPKISSKDLPKPPFLSASHLWR